MLPAASSRRVTSGVVVNIEFVVSFSPFVEDIAGARRFYGEELGIEFEGGEEEDAFTEQLGVKHLGLWPLSQAAWRHRPARPRSITAMASFGG
jgi:hypothetical protein